jgi:hypothetical protein
MRLLIFVTLIYDGLKMLHNLYLGCPNEIQVGSRLENGNFLFMFSNVVGNLRSSVLVFVGLLEQSSFHLVELGY